VLGGGITGLTAAFDLARSLPKTNITLYEKSTRLGGWIDSEVVPVDDGEVLFEWGPRSVRPALNDSGVATAQLVSTLGGRGAQLNQSRLRTWRMPNKKGTT
jgi:protoporphyrinogen/coproporphyrinogen III oxidase